MLLYYTTMWTYVTSWGTRRCTGKLKDYDSWLIAFLSIPVRPHLFILHGLLSPFSIFQHFHFLSVNFGSLMQFKFWNHANGQCLIMDCLYTILDNFARCIRITSLPSEVFLVLSVLLLWSVYACLIPIGGYNHFLLGTEDLFYYFLESCVTFKNL